MDFRMRIMIALLLISQQAGGDVNPSGERAGSSKSHHKLHRRGSAQSKPDETKTNNNLKTETDTDIKGNLEWVRSATVPKDAIYVKDDESYYVTKKEDCTICFFDSAGNACVEWHDNEKNLIPVKYDEIKFLVNRDDFEIMEWKKYNDPKISPMLMKFCNGYFIAKNVEKPLRYFQTTAEDLMKQSIVNTEVLTLNTDIKMQHLNVIEYLVSSVVTSENLEVLKHFQASNKNCKPAKHTVKFDQNIDKTTSYQTGKTHTVGGNVGVTVSGGVASILKIGGNFGLKYDFSRPSSKTTSEVEKTLHSVGMEVEVPPNHSCVIDITSNTFKTEVPFTGEMTRTYNNNQIRKTFVNGTYIQQEVTEMQTLVNPCLPLSGGSKCVGTDTTKATSVVNPDDESHKSMVITEKHNNRITRL